MAVALSGCAAAAAELSAEDIACQVDITGTDHRQFELIDPHSPAASPRELAALRWRAWISPGPDRPGLPRVEATEFWNHRRAVNRWGDREHLRNLTIDGELKLETIPFEAGHVYP